MKIALIDFETSGLDKEKERIIEIGAAVYNFDSHLVEKEYSRLCWDEGDEEISEHIQEITGITNEELRSNGVPFKAAIAKFADITKECKVFMAHNVSFDRDMLHNNLKRINIEPPPVRWMCSIADLDHGKLRCMQLSHLALDYGITVNPKTLHRALDDVLLLGDILRARGQSWAEILEYADSPQVYLILEVPPPWEDQGKGKDFAKSQGYRWENAGDRTFKKKWVKALRECHLEAEKQKDTGGYPRKLIRSDDGNTKRGNS